MAAVHLVILSACFYVGAVLTALANGRSVERHVVFGNGDDSAHKLLKLDGKLVKWGVPQLGAPATVTYALATALRRSRTARNCQQIAAFDRLAQASRLPSEAVTRELEAAFAAWSEVANIRFRRVADADSADIVVGTQLEPRGWAFANVAPRTNLHQVERGLNDISLANPGQTNTGQGISAQSSRGSSGIAQIDKAMICMNATRSWKIGYDGDLQRYDLRHTFMHEIGHAIGLDHPRHLTQLMHYKYSETGRELKRGDIAGAVRLYGAPPPAAK